ncbi:MAG: hypothetical protein AB8G05_21565 [Oligoflexales bacterium]
MIEIKEQEERRMASRDLMSFLTQYTQMLELQLEAVRKDMDKTTGELMEGIKEINQSHGLNKSKAEAVLIKEGNSHAEEKKDAFTEVSSRNIEKEEQLQLKKEIAQGAEEISQGMKEAGGKFKSHMSSLKQLDANLHDLLMKMMGTLSTDDVVGQRLEHISSAIKILNKGLVGLVSNFDDKFKLEYIKKMNSSLETKVFKSYTMEVEKKIFTKVFR